MGDPQFMPGYEVHVANMQNAVFGPIEFNLTADGFDVSSIEKVIDRQFERTFPDLYEKCLHGFTLQIGDNNRPLKKSSQLLRYSRNVQSIILTPKIPDERPPEPEEEEEE